MSDGATQSKSFFESLSVWQWVIGLLLTVAVGWGSAQWAMGAAVTKIDNLHARFEQLLAERTREHEQFVRKEAMDLYMQWVRADLQGLKAEVHELREEITKERTRAQARVMMSEHERGN